MSNRNKAKGTSWETEIVNYLNAYGLHAHRTGSADAGSGDIHYAYGWTCEAKNEARIDLPGYLRQLKASAERSGRFDGKAAVWVKNRRHPITSAYVVMSAEAYRDLVVYVIGLEDKAGVSQTADSEDSRTLRRAA